jgi:hypothetical protein
MLTNDRRRYFYPEELPMHVQVKDNLFDMSDNALTGFLGAEICPGITRRRAVWVLINLPITPVNYVIILSEISRISTNKK